MKFFHHSDFPKIRKGTFIFLLVFSLGNLGAYCQTKILTGVILNKATLLPVGRARVAIIGGTEEYTTSSGIFQIQLLGEKQTKPGSEIQLSIYQNDYGLHFEKVTIPEDLDSYFPQLKIEQNNRDGISGMVRDETSKEPIEGIEVTFISPDIKNSSYKAPVEVTNQFGVFRLTWNKNDAGELPFIRLIFKDTKSNCYLSYDEMVQTGTHLKINLERKPECKTGRDVGAEGAGVKPKEPCVEYNYGSVCLENKSKNPYQVVVGHQEQPGFYDMASSKNFTLQSGETKCHEALEPGIWIYIYEEKYPRYSKSQGTVVIERCKNKKIQLY